MSKVSESKNVTENSQKELVDVNALIKRNPIAKLTGTYESKLVNKIKESFVEYEQQIFLQSHLWYLNYHPTKDYVVDLNDVWSELGFNRKYAAKRTLLKNFEENVDFIIKIFAFQSGEAKLGEKVETRGGKNREDILMNIETFKQLCMISGTQKSKEIRKYFIKLEGILHETIDEQSKELRNQLENSSKREKMLISKFKDKKIFYIGFTETVDVEGEDWVKFGWSDECCKRLTTHKKEINEDFIFCYIHESIHNREIEKILKKHPLIRDRIPDKKNYRSYKTVKFPKGKVQTELIKLDEKFTIKNLEKIVLEIDRNICKSRGDINTAEKLANSIEDITKQLDEISGKIPFESKKTEKKTIIPGIKVLKDKNEEINELRRTIRKQNTELEKKQYIARHIETGVETTFKSYSDAQQIAKVGPHSLRDNYLNKPRQARYYTFYEKGSSYWEPPKNFKVDINVKSNTHSVMCKSIHNNTNETTYYNSITEASNIIGLVLEDDSKQVASSKRRKLNWTIDNGKSEDPIISKFTWYRLESCGFLVNPDGSKIDIEKILVKNTTKKVIEAPVIKPGSNNNSTIKGVFEFTEDPGDKLRMVDIDAILRKYKFTTTCKMLKPSLLEWGAKHCGTNKKVKMPGIKKQGVGYTNIKFAKQDDFGLIR
jgi:phage anti-repressor protein